MNELAITRGHGISCLTVWNIFTIFNLEKRLLKVWALEFFGGNFLFFESVISICRSLIPGPFSASQECDFHFLCSQWWWKTQEAAGRALEKLLHPLSRNTVLCSGQMKKMARTMLCAEKEDTKPPRSKIRTYFHRAKVPHKATLWHELYFNIKDRRAEAWKLDA